jgi:hypothetical protein
MAVTAPELDGFLRDQLAQLEEQRPGAARARYVSKWDEARAAFTAVVADKTGLDAAFVADLLDRRDVIRQASPHDREALLEAADTTFVTAVMAASAWTLAGPAGNASQSGRAATRRKAS